MGCKHFFKIANDVTLTWTKVRQIPDYEAKVGSLLFKTLFEKHPDIFEAFPFGEENKEMKSLLQGFNDLSMIIPGQKASKLHTSQVNIMPKAMSMKSLNKRFDYEKDPRFVKHGQRWVRMFSIAIDMLGPDLDVVEKQFMDLGERHKKYNVTCNQLHLMGKILIKTLETVLGRQVFNKEIKNSWMKFYLFIIKAMSKGMNQQYSPREKQHTASISRPLTSSSVCQQSKRASRKNNMHFLLGRS